MNNALRFGLFFVVLLVVVGGLNVAVHRRVSEAFKLSERARRSLAAALGLALVAMVTGRFLGSSASRVVGGTAAVFEVGVLVAAILFLLERGVVRLAGATLARVRRNAEQVVRASSPDAAAPAPDPSGPSSHGGPLAVEPSAPALSRRELLSRASAGAIVIVGGGSASYGGLVGRHDYALEEVPIRLARLPRELDGYTVAQLSDIHLGAFVGDREMARARELVARARPNLIALTGDLVDHDPAFADELGRLIRILGELAPVVLVPGNHDHYAGVGVVLDRARRAGGLVLDNRHVRVGEGRLVLAGVDDLWARRLRLGRGPDLDSALAGIQDDAPRILLAHQPAFFEESSERIDLQLSGHTHGGQFNLGIRPADYVLPNGWVAGRYVRGEAQLYVNRGFGTAGPPARLGAPPEVTRLVLTV